MPDISRFLLFNFIGANGSNAAVYRGSKLRFSSIGYAVRHWVGGPVSCQRGVGTRCYPYFIISNS